MNYNLKEIQTKFCRNNKNYQLKFLGSSLLDPDMINPQPEIDTIKNKIIMKNASQTFTWKDCILCFNNNISSFSINYPYKSFKKFDLKKSYKS